MTKYSFILLSEETEKFLKQIQELGVMDIRRSVKPVDSTSSDMLEHSLEVKQIITSLKKIDYSKDPASETILAAKQNMILSDNPLEKSKELLDRIKNLLAERNSIEMEMKSREPWGSFDKKSLDGIAEQGLDIRFYCVSKKKYDNAWAELYPLQVIKDDGLKIWFVTVTEKGQDYQFPVAEIPAPNGSLNDSEAELKKIADEMIGCKAELLKQKDALPQLEKEYSNGLSDLDLYLAEVSSEKAAENTLSMIVGFAPTSDDAQLKPALDQLSAVCLAEPAAVEDNPPIKLKNGWFARMFEVLTGMYGQPVYDEFDPTPILAPFFLLFFAMCMGDAGYGIVLFIIGCFLKGKQGGLAKSWRLIQALGVGTFVVGIILGTGFGVNLYTQTWVPEWLKKCMIVGNIGAYSAQMVLSLGIGVFHICLAMIIKAIGYTKRFGIKENISNWGWTLLIVGSVVALSLTVVGMIPENITKWVIISIAAISGLCIFIFNKIGRNPLLNIGAGLWDTYQMTTGILGDVLSYIRLYALGLAGGMLGAAFNNLGHMVFTGISIPGLNWLAFIIILLFGHALNLAMSCLGAFVHPLRLTFVEYFKNSGYEGKGVKYKPLQ